MVSQPAISPAQLAHQALRNPLAPEGPDTNDRLLQAYLTQGLDAAAAAHHTSTTIPALLRVLTRPDNQTLIETYQRSALAAFNTRLLAETAQARIDAVKTLNQLSKTVTDPTELRRICNLILRYTTPLTRLPTRPPPRLPRRFQKDSITRAHSSVNDAPASPAPAASSDTPSTPVSTLRSAPSNPEPIPTPQPRTAKDPATVPSHSFSTPAELFAHLERSLLAQRPTNKESRAAAIHNLHRYLAPSCTINTTPVPTDPGAFAAKIDAASEAHLFAQLVQVQRRTIQSGKCSHEERLFLVRHRQRMVEADITLRRDTENDPWRIAAISTRLQAL